MIRIIAVTSTLALLAACGVKGPLKAPGAAADSQSAAVETRSESHSDQSRDDDRPLTPQAAPVRVDDAVNESRDRTSDRFDLPPPGA